MNVFTYVENNNSNVLWMYNWVHMLDHNLGKYKNLAHWLAQNYKLYYCDWPIFNYELKLNLLSVGQVRRLL